MAEEDKSGSSFKILNPFFPGGESNDCHPFYPKSSPVLSVGSSSLWVSFLDVTHATSPGSDAGTKIWETLGCLWNHHSANLSHSSNNKIILISFKVLFQNQKRFLVCFFFF